MIQEAVKIVSSGRDLKEGQMQSVMDEIMTGRAETPQVVSFLRALSSKGESVEELTAAAKVMREHSVKINTKQKKVLDTCGTGGDRKGTFNISTAAAFVVSGCGIAVAKHGNRSVSSCCGSADILEALGVNINLPKEKLEICLNEIGIAFLFAQNLHPAMKFAMPARKEIGKRTIFNILGPLTNPAGATHQLIGVYDKGLTEKLAAVLNNLGTTHALIIHGEDGLDEITTTAKTYICEALNGAVESLEVRPEDFGLKKAMIEDLTGASIEENAKSLTELLNGKTGPKRDIVLLNAGAAIYAADGAATINEGLKLAGESLDSKKALKKFELLKEYSSN